jgi:hypothetical protein
MLSFVVPYRTTKSGANGEVTSRRKQRTILRGEITVGNGSPKTVLLSLYTNVKYI